MVNVCKFIGKEISDYVAKKKVNVKKQKGKEAFLFDEPKIMDLENPMSIQPLKKKLMVSRVITSTESSTLGPLQLTEKTVHDIIRNWKLDEEPFVEYMINAI